MKKLTVGIPTFNRIDCLKKTIAFLLNEKILERNDIEFIVSDNASTDGTRTYLNDLHERYPEIIVNFEETNNGGEYNFSRIIEMATSEYIWLVGDDDIILSGILDDIMNVLNSHVDISWVFVKFDCLMKGGDLKKYELQYKKHYDCGMELFNFIAQSDYKLGAPMFLTASVHKASMAKKAASIFLSSPEFGNNQALTLGLSFYSAFHGSACVTEHTKLIDNIADVSWHAAAVKIFCRDQIAILDLMARSMNVRLLDYVDLEKELVYKRPEWTYFRARSKMNNYAMFFFLRYKPIKVFSDLFQMLKERMRMKSS